MPYIHPTVGMTALACGVTLAISAAAFIVSRLLVRHEQKQAPEVLSHTLST